MSDWNAKVIDEFRANEGRSPRSLDSRSCCSRIAARGPAPSARTRSHVSATGTTSGRGLEGRCTDGSRLVPHWLAHPDATIEVGTDTLQVRARPADEHDRARLWAMITAANLAFAEYEGKTDRTIPVVTLTPVL